jgi:MFS family permease
MRDLWLPIYLPSFLIAAGQQAVLVLLPLYALHLEGGAGFAATLLAMRGLGSLISNIPAGMLVSRLGDKTVMVAALLTLGIAATLLGHTSNLASAAALAMAFGAGSGAWLLSRLVYVTEAAPIASRGRAIAALGGIQRVGLLIGPVVGGTLATTQGFDVAFLIAGACAFASCLIVLPFTRNVKPAQDLTGGPSLRTVAQIMRDHRHTFSTAGLATIGLAVLRSSRQLLIPLWGAAVGLNEAQIGLIFMLTSAVEIAMSYPAGYLLDVSGHKATALPCFGLLALSVLLLPLATSFWTLTGIALIAGVGNGFGTGIMMTMGSDYAPRQRRGEFLGVWRMMGDSGQVGGPLLIGGLAEVITLGGATVGAAVVGLAGMAVMGTVVREPVRE